MQRRLRTFIYSFIFIFIHLFYLLKVLRTFDSMLSEKVTEELWESSKINLHKYSLVRTDVVSCHVKVDYVLTSSFAFVYFVFYFILLHRFISFFIIHSQAAL